MSRAISRKSPRGGKKQKLETGLEGGQLEVSVPWRLDGEGEAGSVDLLETEWMCGGVEEYSHWRLDRGWGSWKHALTGD